MDARQFDAIAKALIAATNRRWVLAAFVGGALGLLRWAESEAGKSGRCRPKCSECQSCQKGTCKKNGKKTCKPGTCKKKPNGTACSGGGVCQRGECVTGQGTCPSGADSCSSGFIPCSGGPTCFCFQRLEGGTRCVQAGIIGPFCNTCSTDADCLALGFPVGSSCVRDDGPHCACLPDPRGSCFAPC